MQITIKVKTDNAEVELSNHYGNKVFTIEGDDGEKAGKLCELIDKAHDVIIDGLKEP